MEIIGGKPSIQMTGLGSRFQYEEKISMLAEALKEYTLESAEAAYVYPGEHEPMVFMASWGLFYDGNDFNWGDQKQPLFTRPN